MATTVGSIHHFPLTTNCHRAGKQTNISAIQESATSTYTNHKISSKNVTRLAQSISQLLHLHGHAQSISQLLHLHGHLDMPAEKSVANHDLIARFNEKQNTSTTSPKEDISKKWREIQGSNDWTNLLDPIHPWLRQEIIKYGEFGQATYDAFDYDAFSEYYGSCRYNRHRLFQKLGLDKHGYNVSKYIYAMSHIELPSWLKRSHLTDTWSKDSNWMGYIAVSDDEETKRIGRRDIMVAWRGTVAPSEWYKDLQRKLEPIGLGKARVEHGFLSIYTSKSDNTRYNKMSVSEQVMKEIKRLVKYYRTLGEEVSITITGHSLGGALALINAYETASYFPNIQVSVISFGAPRVGNIAFRDELYEKGVKTLRVVVQQDFVPRMPGIVLNEGLQRFDDITGSLEWVYTHVGAELKVDVRSSPYLKHGFNMMGFHSLETYLHLVDGYVSSGLRFRAEAGRDVVLVNKACDMIVNELRVPHFWYQMANKGLECNVHGRWIKPKRNPEDIPSPTGESHINP